MYPQWLQLCSRTAWHITVAGAVMVSFRMLAHWLLVSPNVIIVFTIININYDKSIGTCHNRIRTLMLPHRQWTMDAGVHVSMRCTVAERNAFEGHTVMRVF